MMKHEYSLFRGIANVHKDRAEAWVGASDDKPLQGINAWKFSEMREYSPDTVMVYITRFRGVHVTLIF